MSDLPGPLAPTSTQTISGLYTESFVPAGTPRGVVLITHGYAEHCGRYHEVARVIVDAGWAVLSYDVRGHGKSPGQRGYIDRFSTYLADFAAMQAAARDLASAAAPMVLLGHSHGSLITLRALADEQPPRAAAAIVSSPFLALRLKIPAYRRALASVASRLAPKLSQPNALRVEDLTQDTAKQAERLADKLCFDVATARWFTEALAAQAYVFEHAGRIKLPTTWLVGHDDPIADPARSQAVAAKISGVNYHDLVGMRHEVFNEVERAKVFSELTKALAAAG
ncbi:MAG: lysophospholipase [Deltaproteobacteria bacterium]|nr:MAG: lysophospholipase [Deltaproteobacteria bacterium]